MERRIAKQSKGAFNNKELAKEVGAVKEPSKPTWKTESWAHSFEPTTMMPWSSSIPLNLLTWKPVIFAANVTEDDLANDGADNQYVQAVRGFAGENNCEVFVICAEIEQEIAELDDDEKKMFLDDLGLTESGLEKHDCSQLPHPGAYELPDSRPPGEPCMDYQGGHQGTPGSRKDYSDFERGFIQR